MRKLITLLGVPLDVLSMDETIDQLVKFVRTGRESRKSHQVATVNVDFLVKAIYDPDLRKILQEVDMATIDGMPLVWGARWLGMAIRSRVAGSDFIPLLIQRATQEGLTIFLLGAAPDVSSKAAEILQKQYPALVICGVLSPPFSPIQEMDPGIVETIKAADPDILLVAFGNPKQEKWIKTFGSRTQVPLMIGIGATLDFIAGQMQRAPYWMQQVGLEWLYRLMQEPSRLLKRYVKDIFVFTYYFSRQWWMQRPRSQVHSDNQKVWVHANGQHPIIEASGSLEVNGYEEIWSAGQKALEISDKIFLDLKACTFIDSSATGALMGLAKEARDRGGKMALLSSSKTVQKLFSFHQVEELFSSGKNQTNQQARPRYI